jgi:hypothetical protein
MRVGRQAPHLRAGGVHRTRVARLKRRRKYSVDGAWNKRTGWRIYAGMRLQILVAALLLSLATPLNANVPVSMAVSPVQSFAPAKLIIRLHVEPDAANRTLEVVAESGEYYRSSSIQLNGSDAPRTISFEFRDVSGGNYDVRGTLIRSAGKARAAVPVIDPKG